jgi:hypothetical protein
MAVNITLNGASAEEVLADLQTLAKAMLPPEVTYRLTLPVGDVTSDVRMAASVPEDDEPAVVTAEAAVEDKPARKRRTKAEMEAARRAGEPPQDGDPDLDPEDTEPVSVIDVMEDALNNAAPADILDDEPTAHVPTREETSKLMLSVMNNKLRSPLELKTMLKEIGGEACTNLATVAEPFIPEIYARFAAILADAGK